MGHQVTEVATHSEMMGHAGGILIRTDGIVEAASDPRSDGAALVANC